MTGATLYRDHSTPPEYRYSERFECDAETVAELMEEFAPNGWRICPEEEVPAIHCRDGATVIRWYDAFGSTWVYELLWPGDQDDGPADPGLAEYEAAQQDVAYTEAMNGNWA